MSKNPIPYNGLFHTPESAQELIDWISRLSGSERVVAMTAAYMALNLAHKLNERRD